MLVVYRRGRASEVVDLVDVDKERLDDVVSNEFEVIIFVKMFDIDLAPGKKIVYADYPVSRFEEAFA